MKRSRFRLETILRVKEHVEKERQRLLALATERKMQQEAKIARVLDQKGETLGSQRETASHPMFPAQMLAYSRYLLRLRREELMGMEMLKALSLDEEKKRKELIAATKEKKTIEKLKEKHQRAVQSEQDTAEAKSLDELAIIAHARHRV